MKTEEEGYGSTRGIVELGLGRRVRGLPGQSAEFAEKKEIVPTNIEDEGISGNGIGTHLHSLFQKWSLKNERDYRLRGPWKGESSRFNAVKAPR